MKSKTALKTACLAAGMATAWGGASVQASVVPFEGVIHPTTDLEDVTMFFTTNSSHVSEGIHFVGDISGNQDTSFTFSGAPTANSPGYIFMGIYDDGGTPGVTLSFADPSDIIGQKTWSDIFEDPNDGIDNYSEASVVSMIQNAPTNSSSEANLGRFVRYYYPLLGGASLDSDSVLVNFSVAEAGGTVSIPEPATAGILAVGGMFFLLRVRKSNW